MRAESGLSLPGEGDAHNGTLHHTAVAGAKTHHQKPVLLLGGPGEQGLLAAKLPRAATQYIHPPPPGCLPEAPPPVGNTPNSSTMVTPLPCRILALPPFLRMFQGSQTCPKVPSLLKLQCLVPGGGTHEPQPYLLALGHYLSMWIEEN